MCEDSIKHIALETPVEIKHDGYAFCPKCYVGGTLIANYHLNNGRGPQ